MPYIIAVLAFVVIGVGFTLYQPSEQPANNLTADNTPTLAELKETIETEITEETETGSSTESATLATVDETQPGPTPVLESTPSPTPAETKPSTPAEEPAVAPTPTPTPAPAPVPETPAYDYRNGTYNTSVTYRTPMVPTTWTSVLLLPKML